LVDPLTASRLLFPVQPEIPIWEILDKMMTQMDDRDDVSSSKEQVFERTASGLTFTLTTGYVSWLLRAGYLSASLLSVLPLWREFDPLPILARPKDKKRKNGRDDPESQDAQDSQESDENEVERIFAPSAGAQKRSRFRKG